MKAAILALTTLVSAFLSGPALAQGHAAHHTTGGESVQCDSSARRSMMQGPMMSQGMMSGGMMRGQMMRCSMCGQMMKGCMTRGTTGDLGMMAQHDALGKLGNLIQRLPGLTKQLSLTDDQAENLKKIRAEFLKREADRSAAIRKKRIDLSLLLDEQAPSSRVRATLRSVHDTKVEMGTDVYETYQKMLAVLTAEQKRKLKTLPSQCAPGHGMMQGMMGPGKQSQYEESHTDTKVVMRQEIRTHATGYV